VVLVALAAILFGYLNSSSGTGAGLISQAEARDQSAPGGEKHETPEWILQGYEWETLPLMDELHEEFNEQFGTDFQFPLRPKTE